MSAPDGEIELLGREPLLRSYLEVDHLRFRHRLFAGGMSGEVSREVLLRGAAVVVMPYDVKRDRIVLVEQFRVGAYVNGEPPWLLEAIAGLVEPGETPAEVAIREAREEAGLALTHVHHVLDYYASPGALSEKAILFWASADTDGIGGVHGLDHEHEDIRVHVMDFTDAMQALEAGRIRSATGLVALQWLALNRGRLRNGN